MLTVYFVFVFFLRSLRTSCGPWWPPGAQHGGWQRHTVVATGLRWPLGGVALHPAGGSDAHAHTHTCICTPNLCRPKKNPTCAPPPPTHSSHPPCACLTHLNPQLSRRAARRWELPEQEVPVPPHLQVVSGLRSYCNYSARVSCVNEVGASPFSPWLHFRTPESGNSAAARLVCSAHIHINKKQTKTVAKNKKKAAGLH